MANPSREELDAAVTKIQSPMLVVVGDLDRLAPNARALATAVPGARLHVVIGLAAQRLLRDGAGVQPGCRRIPGRTQADARSLSKARPALLAGQVSAAASAQASYS